MSPAGVAVAPGVLLRMRGRGVLLTGPAGCGKSRLALELLDRGHALVADDAPLLRRAPGGGLVGSAAASQRGFLHVRGLGVVDVAQIFGPEAVLPHQMLDLEVALVTHGAADPGLGPRARSACYLGTGVPVLELAGMPPFAPVMVEALVAGFRPGRAAGDAALRLAARQARLLRRQTPDRQSG